MISMAPNENSVLDSNNTVPTVTVNSSAVCVGDVAVVVATPGIEGNYDYAWDVPTGANNPGNVASFTTTVAGTYTVVISTIQEPICSSGSVSGTVTFVTPPTVTVESSTICAGQTATITANPGTLGDYNYEWSVPSEATNPGNVSSFSTMAAGDYSVLITTASGITCSSESASGTVTVVSLPTVTVNSSIICEGDSATVTATTGISGTYEYVWTVPSGAGNPGDVPSFSTINAGEYSVSITTTGGITCNSDPAFGNVNILPLPTVSVNSSTICAGQSITVTATPGTPGDYEYVWSVPSGGNNPGDVSSFSTMAAGEYSVSITATSEITCISNPGSGTVNILPLPTVAVNSLTICSGESATIIATPGSPGAYEYSWTVPTGVISPGNVSSFSANVAGDYSVIITTTELALCSSDTASGDLIISPLPDAGMIFGAEAHCAGINSDTLFAGSAIGNLQWYSGSTPDSLLPVQGAISDSIVVTNLLDSMYFTVVAVTYGCFPDTSEFTLIPIGENVMTSYLPENTELCAELFEYFIADTSYTTTWFVDGLAVADSLSIFGFSVSEAGNYVVSNLSRSNTGCAISDSVSVIVNPIPEQVLIELLTEGLLGFEGSTAYETEWGITGANTGIELYQSSGINYNFYSSFDPLNNYYWVEFTNEFGCTSRSYYNEPVTVIESKKPFVICYPNPAIDKLYIKLEPTNSVSFEYLIFDSIGGLNLSGVISSNETTVDVSALDSGLYVLSVNAPDTSYTLRFVIR